MNRHPLVPFETFKGVRSGQIKQICPTTIDIGYPIAFCQFDYDGDKIIETIGDGISIKKRYYGVANGVNRYE